MAFLSHSIKLAPILRKRDVALLTILLFSTDNKRDCCESAGNSSLITLLLLPLRGLSLSQKFSRQMQQQQTCFTCAHFFIQIVSRKTFSSKGPRSLAPHSALLQLIP